MRTHKLHVQQTGPNHLFVNIFPRAGTVVANHVGTGPHNWRWEIECNLCGEAKTNTYELWNRLRTESQMLNHAKAHLKHDPDGGPDAGFTGYGWEKSE